MDNLPIDNFQSSFKYYKSKDLPPSLENVMTLNHTGDPLLKPIKAIPQSSSFPGLRPPESWNVSQLTSRPGLVVIANPFTGTGQRYWMSRSVLDFHRGLSKNNLLPSQFNLHQHPGGWWEHLQTIGDPLQRQKLSKALRWATLGFHYDWTNKVYSDGKRTQFPNDLAAMVQYVASALGISSFSPEAAIVNYYPIGSTLAGHTDHSEEDLTVPLFSFSFGLAGIFLIGGTTREEKPDALLLMSGDVVVMTGNSRQYYHAVPRVCASGEIAVENCRWQPGCQSNEFELDQQSDGGTEMCSKHWQKCHDNDFWSPIHDYMQGSRININVRQVRRLKG
ncbi:nucleic acid dioxygenase ALKBH1 [Anopheles cruzii]|uniref:nucleic acid dioxygenase ALKBH1 n=1 Tax=Anopheles cruzii TaxID=68878 RepID=UPI0022EC1CF7|nr:nucleic acid dioxygenase ALKBH1 [Anopheles cruzii]